MSNVILQQVDKAFDGRVNAVRQLDLAIEDGEFFVLLGPSGCGKTTTLRCIAGLEEPESGRITLAGEVVVDGDRGLFIAPEKRRIGMVFQNYALWPHMTVRQNVAYPLKAHPGSREEHRRAVDEALALVGLDSLAQRYPAELSGGQQQRIALARALVGKPRLLLFDEPLSNLDAQLRLRLRRDLRRIHRELGYTAVYVTHDHAEALALADRIAVMKAGRLEQVGTPSEIFLSPRTRYVAEFVGFENLYPATLAGSANGQARVRLDDSDLILPARNPSGLAPGATAWLAVRAAQLTALPLSTSVPEGVLALTGELLDASYAGERYIGEVRVAGHSLSVNLPLDGWGDARLQPGLPLRVLWPASAALVLPRGEDEQALQAELALGVNAA